MWAAIRTRDILADFAAHCISFIDDVKAIKPLRICDVVRLPREGNFVRGIVIFLPGALLPGRFLITHRAPLLAFVDVTVTTMPTGFGFKPRPSRLINQQRGRRLGSSNNRPGSCPATADSAPWEKWASSRVELCDGGKSPRRTS